MFSKINLLSSVKSKTELQLAFFCNLISSSCIFLNLNNYKKEKKVIVARHAVIFFI